MLQTLIFIFLNNGIHYLVTIINTWLHFNLFI